MQQALGFSDTQFAGAYDTRLGIQPADAGDLQQMGEELEKLGVAVPTSFFFQEAATYEPDAADF